MLVEYLDELVADDLAFLFRILDAFERRHETLFRIGPDHLDTEVLGEDAHDLVALVEPQQPGVDEHANELVADCRMQQGRHHGGIDPARQAEQHAIIADRFAHALDVLGDDVGRRPVSGTTADVDREAANDLQPCVGMRHLGMKLHAVKTPVHVCHGRERRVG